MKKLVVGLLAVAAMSASVWAGLALAESVVIGNATFTADGSFSPKKLPKKEWAPIELKTSGSVTTDDGSTPPVADVVTVDFDKNGTLTTKGIKTCDPKKLQNTTTAQAKRKCKKALVGQGTTKAIVDFEDQDPFDAIGPLLVFNGKPKGGKPTIIFHVLANVPLPTTFVVQSVVVPSPKKGFGKRIVVKVPPIAGGNGTLVSFNATINKKPATGKKYLLARCANGRFVADAHVELRDGRNFDISLVRPCKAKK
jgi:hypothetical protein